jgi:hypothetical protein
MRKRIVRSIVYGILLQAFAIYLVFMTDAGPATRWILWNGTIVDLLLGSIVPHPPRGAMIYDPDAGQIITHGVAALILGIATYAALVYLALGMLFRRNGDLRRREPA